MQILIGFLTIFTQIFSLKSDMFKSDPKYQICIQSVLSNLMCLNKYKSENAVV